MRPTASVTPALLLLALLTGACPGRERDRAARRAREARESRERLRALPYLQRLPVKREDQPKRGVTRHDPRRAWQGVNLYNSAPRAVAQLIDMNGRELGRWSSDEGQPSRAELEWTKIWPHLDLAGWQHVELAADGGLYAIVNLHALLRLDRSSRVLWKAELAAHHDLDVAETGEIYTLADVKRRVRRGQQVLRVLDSQVVVLSPEGKPRRRISLLDVLRRSPATARFVEEKLRWAAERFREKFAAEHLALHVLQNEKNAQRTAAAFEQILADRFEGTRRVELMLMSAMPPMDILHTNTIEVLRRDVPDLGRRGDLLLSVRDLDLVLVLDPRTLAVRWTYGPGLLDRQHHPSVLENGNVLIFDNAPSRAGSRVIEVHPASRSIVWSYTARPPDSFHSLVRGGCQRLPGGTTLITDSERGRAFEVTRSGEVVWEFFNPDLDDPYLGRGRAPIYRLARLRPEALSPTSQKSSTSPAPAPASPPAPSAHPPSRTF